MIVLGIDPGKDGAIVALRGREVLYQERTSRLLAGSRWEAGADALADALRSIVVAHRPGLAVLELYAGRPAQGRGSMLTVGVGWGTWRGLLAGLGVPVLAPASSAWTRDLFRAVPGEGKDRAIAVARTLAGLDVVPVGCRKPHDGIADAACLALWAQAHPLARTPR